MSKSIINLIGAALILSGSIVLMCYGHSIAGVFEILTMQVVPDEPHQTPVALNNVPFTAGGATLLAIGVSLSSLVRFTRNGVARWLTNTADAVVIAGCLAISFAVLQCLQSFRVIATSPAAPRQDEVLLLIHSSSVLLMVGFTSLVVASVLMIASATMNLRSQSAWQRWQVALPIGFFLLVSLQASLSFYNNGYLLLRSIQGGLPNPSELVGHLMSSQNSVVIIFACVAVQATLHLVTGCMFPTSPQQDSSSEG